VITLQAGCTNHVHFVTSSNGQLALSFHFNLHSNQNSYMIKHRLTSYRQKHAKIYNNGTNSRPDRPRGNGRPFDLLSMPVEDLVNVAKRDLVLAFHPGRHRHFTFVDRLHVALHSTLSLVNFCSSITPCVFHSRLKTYPFHRFFPRSFTSSPDCLRGLSSRPFLLSYSVFGFSFSLFFRFGAVR